MSGTFLVIFIVLLIMFTFWRLTLVIVFAFLLTMLLSGVNGIVEAIDAGQHDQRAVPAPPGHEAAPDFRFEPPR
jgi:hypothetical protein